MSDQQKSQIYLASYGSEKDHPREFRAYENRDAALEWLASQGLAIDKLDQYNELKEYEAAVIDGVNYQLHELEVY